MIDLNSIRPTTFWLETILPLVLILVSGILVICGFFDYFKTLRWRRRPRTAGTVIKSETLSVHRGCRPWITYRYEAGGKIYESHNFFYGQHRSKYSLNSAQKKIAPYPPGTPLRVYYDPENPQDALVIPESYIFIFFIAAFAFLLKASLWAAILWFIELKTK